MMRASKKNINGGIGSSKNITKNGKYKIDLKAELFVIENNTLYVIDRNEWREWLINNFDTEKEIWLIYPKKSSNRPRINYNDAVEEALCFGWIDSKIKSLDNDNTIQRFSPRKPNSSYSQANIERLKWLFEKNLIHPTVLVTIQPIINKKFDFPLDILYAIKEDDEAWKNFNSFSLSYQRIRIAYIDVARNRPDEFKKRLKNFINKTKKSVMIGFGGIEKYY